MILIIGSSHDDVLYFESLMTKKHNDVILHQYPVTFGHIFNQDVALVSEVYTNYISSIITQYMYSRYFVFLVIAVGTCIGYSDDVRPYDIAFSDQVMLGDVDQIALRPVALGEIPGNYPVFYPVSNEVRNFMATAIDLRISGRNINASYLSSNTFYTRYEQVKPLLVNGQLSRIHSGLVLDCTYGGIALAGKIFNIPTVALKVVETTFGKPINFEEYQHILEAQQQVGKAIVTAIGNIGSNDVLKGISD